MKGARGKPDMSIFSYNFDLVSKKLHYSFNCQTKIDKSILSDHLKNILKINSN